MTPNGPSRLLVNGCPDRNFQDNRRIARHDAVPHSQGFANTLLEFFEKRTIISQPRAIQDIGDASEKPLSVTKVWTANMELLLKRRFLA